MDGQTTMHRLRLTGILVLAVAAGCAGGNKAAPDTTPEPEATVAAPPPVESQPVEPPPAVAPAIEPEAAAPEPAEPVAVETPRPEAKPAPTVSPAKPSAAPPETAVAVAAPVVKEPAPAAPVPAAAKPESPPPAAKPPAPTLDVTTLKEKLKETKAIGVFTKLALKNQVDDLLNQFQAHYQTRQPPVEALRQAYNMLVLKVLSLIQDGDPTLARTIATSREAIWGMLADPVKFKSLM